MKNIEFYKEKMLQAATSETAISSFCEGFVVPTLFGGDRKHCENTSCDACYMLQLIWALEEHKEPEPEPVDWSKVPVDTKIYYRDYPDENWKPAYFGGIYKGDVYRWTDGATSFTETGRAACTFAKLAEDLK